MRRVVRIMMSSKLSDGKTIPLYPYYSYYKVNRALVNTDSEPGYMDMDFLVSLHKPVLVFNLG